MVFGGSLLQQLQQIWDEIGETDNGVVETAFVREPNKVSLAEQEKEALRFLGDSVFQQEIMYATIKGCLL